MASRIRAALVALGGLGLTGKMAVLLSLLLATEPALPTRTVLASG